MEVWFFASLARLINGGKVKKSLDVTLLSAKESESRLLLLAFRFASFTIAFLMFTQVSRHEFFVAGLFR